MDVENLATAPEIPDHLKDILPHLVAAFGPGPYTEGQAPMFAISCDLLGATVTIVMGKDFGDAVHLCQRRIIRMEGKLHIGFLGHRQNSFYEVGVIGPDVVGGILAVEELLLHFCAKI